MDSSALALDERTASGARRKGFRRGPARMMLALCEALLPEDASVPRAPERVAGVLLGQARLLTPLARIGFFVGLRLLDWSPWLLLQAPSRLSALPAARRREIFERWLHSRIYLRRQLGLAYNGTIFMCYYGLPEVHALLGYGIEEHVEQSRARRESLLEADRAAGRGAPRAPSMIRR